MGYFTFNTVYDVMRHLDETMTPTQLYHGMKRLTLSGLAAGQEFAPEWNRLQGEKLFHELGKPYYKVDNAAVAMFRKVNIDVPFRYLKVPYGAFAIHFEEDNPFHCGKWHMQSMLVCSQETFEHQMALQLWCDLGEKDIISPHPPVLNYISLLMHEEEFISKHIEDMPLRYTGSDLHDAGIEGDILRIAVSICFLATGGDKLIRPDVLSKDLASWLEAVRRNDAERQTTIEQRAKRRGKFGYVVSGERSYLHPRSSSHDGDGTGRELSHQHQRGCHFRYYKTGLVKLIRQHTVRPDLPARDIV
jgi:hypothetical protein